MLRPFTWTRTVEWPIQVTSIAPDVLSVWQRIQASSSSIAHRRVITDAGSVLTGTLSGQAALPSPRSHRLT